MIKNLLLFLFFTNIVQLKAQTVKTDVLVIGGSASGFAAAIQSARSNAKTIIAEQDTFPDTGNRSVHSDSGSGAVTFINENPALKVGIWDEIRLKLMVFHNRAKDFDTLAKKPLHYDLWSCSEILKNMSDTLKNLTVYTNSNFISIKKDGDYWEVSIIQNGKIKNVKTRLVIDATTNGSVAAFLKTTILPLDSLSHKFGSNLFRTSIAVAEDLSGKYFYNKNASGENHSFFPAFSIPIKTVIDKDVDNLLITEKLFPAKTHLNYLPQQLLLGQGVGAFAAYCAFYKTNTKKIKIRIIQGELLDFKASLFPFTDITPADPNWRAVQQVTATGLLLGVQKIISNNQQYLFEPDSLVSIDEIKPVLTEIYNRAFLWFEKVNPGNSFTIANMLSFISDHTLTDPQLLNSNIQKAWKSKFKFKKDFDPRRQINRMEFAVLANYYLNPFARTIDIDGRFIN